MWSKLTVAGCVLLTAFVLHTALRIEHLNSQIGTFLPRAPGLEAEEWKVPELEHVLDFVDSQIAKQRSNRFAIQHPDEELPPTETFVGEPYSPEETVFIDHHKRDHAIFSELHSWVYSFGAWQYALAPLACVWAVSNAVTLRKFPLRVLSTLCAVVAFAAIHLMVMRGY